MACSRCTQDSPLRLGRPRCLPETLCRGRQAAAVAFDLLGLPALPACPTDPGANARAIAMSAGAAGKAARAQKGVLSRQMLVSRGQGWLRVRRRLAHRALHPASSPARPSSLRRLMQPDRTTCRRCGRSRSSSLRPRSCPQRPWPSCLGCSPLHVSPAALRTPSQRVRGGNVVAARCATSLSAVAA